MQAGFKIARFSYFKVLILEGFTILRPQYFTILRLEVRRSLIFFIFAVFIVLTLKTLPFKISRFERFKI